MTLRWPALLPLLLLLAAAPASAQEAEAPAPSEADSGDEPSPERRAPPPDDELAPEPEPDLVVPVEPPPPVDPVPTDGPSPPLREPADVEPPLTPVEEDAAPAAEETSLGAALRQRQEVQPWHIAFGTATGVSTYLMTILGYLTYADRYGFDGPPGCSASGTPIFGRQACTEPPLAHLVAVSTASTLFTTTFVLGLFMPDPLNSADAGGTHATLLTVHKSLRWALLVLFAGQLALGAVTSNINTDIGTQRDLATAHLVIGTATMFTMTTQGVIGSLMEW